MPGGSFTDRASSLRRLVEQGLEGLFGEGGPFGGADVPPGLVAACRHAVLGGGKRLRPVLCLAAAQAACGRPEPALGPALALELMHCYTLVHDDLPCMDDDLVRRGRPTVHAAFGVAEAVLAGDALQAAAFAVALGGGAPARCARELALAAGPGGVVGGQFVDVTAEPPHDEARIAFVHEHKTADFVRCACRTGAIAAGAPERAVEEASAFGRSLGLAFQLVDDLLDASDPRKAEELSALRALPPGGVRAAAERETDAALAALSRFAAALGGDAASGPRREALDMLRDIARSQLSRTF